MDPCIKALMNLSFIWRRFDQRDAHGMKSYLPAVTLKGYKKSGLKMQRNTFGEELISKECLYLDGTTIDVGNITTDDLITNAAGIEYPILEVVPYYDGVGNLDIVEVFI